MDKLLKLYENYPVCESKLVAIEIRFTSGLVYSYWDYIRRLIVSKILKQLMFPKVVGISFTIPATGEKVKNSSALASLICR